MRFLVCDNTNKFEKRFVAVICAARLYRDLKTYKWLYFFVPVWANYNVVEFSVYGCRPIQTSHGRSPTHTSLLKKETRNEATRTPHL